MNENGMQSLSNDQRKFLIDSSQVYKAYIEARRHFDLYRYGMTWKQAGGREYLFRLTGRTGYGKSLGLRSKETEQIYLEFQKGKDRAQERMKGLAERLDGYAKINKALRLGRIPNWVSKLLRLLDERDLLDEDFMVIGTQALFAYESAVGVRIDSQLATSGDVDLMFDTRNRLSIATSKLDSATLTALLRKVNRSFAQQSSNSFRAVNKEDLLVNIYTRNDLASDESLGLQWLMDAPRFDAICIGKDGWPTRMVVPDPRAFSAHKHWLSTRSDREPSKKPRDAWQADTVRQITLKYFPHLSFEDQAPF